ncbi:unnamed protein product [Ambrosiozyma monospora]|uniref:Unnamed protein product n=1 Tax=Ambrosiozyma monospora TaxID=43982 RepID=A0A9W6YMX7_AMBMO|nr:unnamed protein product [Ambrosiozyma monospora]
MSTISKSVKYSQNVALASTASTLSSTEDNSINKGGLTEINDEDTTSMMLNTMDEGKPSFLVLLLTFLTSFSGFMFGYDTGYISSALVAIGDDFGTPLSYGQEQFITAATSCGALVTSITAGPFTDIVGRKPVLMFSNILFVVGAIIQCAAQTPWTMIAGRFVMGFGVGIGSLIAPLYISELAPPRYRGRMVVINCLAITGGQLIAYAIGAGLDKVHNGWRVVVGLSMIPPTVQFIAFFFLPDTPRFLISKGKYEQAASVLQKVHPNASSELIGLKINELDHILNSIPGDSVFAKIYNGVKEIHKVPSNLRALILSCGLQGIQQFCGFNALMYFSGTIFKAVGFSNATAVSIVVAGTNFVFTLVAFFIIDRVGRRLMLLISTTLMASFLVLNAIAFHFINITFQGNDAIVHGNTDVWGPVIIVAMMGFVASYAVGCGNVPWQQSEMFPQSVRGLGASYATATNWSGSLVISSTFLTMLKNITPTGTFALFAGITVVSFIFVALCYPELSNLKLEEVQLILTGGFNIRASMNLAKLRKRGLSESDHHRAVTELKKNNIEHEHIDSTSAV